MRGACFALALLGCTSCGPSGGAPAPAAWHVVLHDLTPTLLSVWGTAPDDVFAVGGPLGNGTPATILHFDGGSWTDLSPGGAETFWWVHGTSTSDVWAVGEKGRITHWDGTRFTEHASGTTATLFGVWAGGPGDVWAVGGTPEGGTSRPNDVVLHFDGASWSQAPLPQALGRTFYKIWGAPSSGSTTLYIVGELGTIWHRIGTTWTLEANHPPLATGNLTTVNGCSDHEVYAVGGNDVLVSDGTTWTRAKVSLENGVNGIACSSPGNVVIVGSGGLKQRLVAGASPWVSDFADEPHDDLHGAWADPSGGYWAVGGHFADLPVAGMPRAGVLGYYGSAPPSSKMAH
jgi:hypothetical protein